jgi:Cu-processing system ATP-binding protein
MILIRGLSKRYGALTVLSGVDLTIRGGRVTALVGPNGAGKTTLIKILLGLATADAGEILVDGVRVGGDPAYRAGIGYMPQIARFPEHLTGSEVLGMLEGLRGPGAARDFELLERFDLGAQMDRPLRALSGGTRQKLNAAAAFLFAPRLAVLDEPTSGLDPLSSEILKDKIRAERDRGRTFVLASHVMSDLEELADDIVFLVDGAARYAGAVSGLERQTGQQGLERALAGVMIRGGA